MFGSRISIIFVLKMYFEIINKALNCYQYLTDAFIFFEVIIYIDNVAPNVVLISYQKLLIFFLFLHKALLMSTTS